MISPTFPSDFAWGAATSAYQVEGAATEDGRGESIWDRFSHTPGAVADGGTGDVATDHYHRYREDVALLADLGFNAYRFSIAWPRVIPTGGSGVNAAGLDFYDRLVDELLAHGIAPHATLYHWDLPQPLEDAGGWPVRQTAEAFAAYADVVARRLGDRLASLATHNEPFITADHGYRQGNHAPGRRDPRAALAASHHLLVSHGLALQAIRAAAPDLPAGIVLNLEPTPPASGHPLDVEAANLAHQRVNRWFLDPLVGAGYPQDMADAWEWDRTEIRPGDVELIAGRMDFLGVNYYARNIARSPLLPALPPAPDRETTGLGWEVYPQGLREVLDFVVSRTGDLPLYVMENGAAYPDDPADPSRDPQRISYLRRHLEVAANAVADGVPLRGYFAWSLLDNFEWALGYGPRFGIVHVDYASGRRTPRDSARFLSEVARTGRIPPARP